MDWSSAMIDPGMRISALDGVAALTGLHGVKRSVERVEAISVSARCRGGDCQDQVDLSPEALRAADLTEQEQQSLRELEQRDREVRTHEQAHKVAAGPHAGPVSYSFTTGPDGRSYATGGEVQIDVAPVEGDPDATVRKMQQVRRAALAPGEPSTQDRRVAARAQQLEREAQAEVGGQDTKRDQPGQLVDVTG